MDTIKLEYDNSEPLATYEQNLAEHVTTLLTHCKIRDVKRILASVIISMDDAPFLIDTSKITFHLKR